MNATSLYVSTCRLVLQADVSDRSSWTDLYRLVPYLRQSLSCTVCGDLLHEPHTPSETNCQHHVCKMCRGGRKKLKPSCSWCKDYEKYVENVQLRILLQCYKKLCEYLISTDIYKTLLEQHEPSSSLNGGVGPSNSLVDFIQEAANFSDDYKSTGGLSKTEYSILPCVYATNATTLHPTAATATVSCNSVPFKTSPRAATSPPHGKVLVNGYANMSAGTSNKAMLKRKAFVELEYGKNNDGKCSEALKSSSNFKKPTNRSRTAAVSKKKGCRCGNATATPGKLTCCGQRCPCYVDSKPCADCKCKGCRNPHRADGLKVPPHLSQSDSVQFVGSDHDRKAGPSTGSVDSLQPASVSVDKLDEIDNSHQKPLKKKVPKNLLEEISPVSPAAIMDEDLSSPSLYPEELKRNSPSKPGGGESIDPAQSS